MEQQVSWDGFTCPSYDQWKKQVIRELGDKPFETLLKSAEHGFIVEPFYSADHHGPVLMTAEVETHYLFRMSKDGWDIRQDFSGSAADIKPRILMALEGGITSLGIRTECADYPAFRELMEGIWIEMISLHLMPGDLNAAVHLAWVGQLAAERKLDTRELKISLGVSDWMGLPERDRHAIRDMARTRFPRLQAVVIHAADLAAAGGTAVQELTFALCRGKQQLEALIEDGFTVDEAAAMILFHLGTGTHYFGEMAKIRAFRRQWMEVIRAFEPAHTCSLYATVHAETSPRVLALTDIHTNLLRTSTAAMSAVLGGADSLSVLACDARTGKSTADTERWARNVQHLLWNEAGLDKAMDPIAGSWYMESLVYQLANASWEAFIQLESDPEACNKLMAEAEVSGREEEQALEAGQNVRIGVNKYLIKS